MKVAIGGQGSAFLLKEAVKESLMEKGYELFDVGQTDPIDNQFYFVDTVERVAEKIKTGVCERGIIMCGSGTGVSMVANKIRGIYCVPCESVFTAERVYPFNQVNVMAMGAMVVTAQMASEMAIKFLESKCEGSALEDIKKVEAKYFK
ncbi:MAG: RpiB/LacA/LacB family sugar-phosphate isomerase [Hungatella sp.]